MKFLRSNLTRGDAAFTGGILLGIAILSGLLYYFSTRTSAGSGQQIGKVFFKREVAMRKFADRMVWEDVESGTPLYSHDAVMTGSLSDAELRLDSGLKLKLEANTLVELDLEKEGLTLKLSGGGIKTAGVQNTQTVVQTQSGQAINVTDASANIRTQGNQTAVEVKEGKVEVTAKDGKKETVNKNEVLAAGKKARVALQVNSPADDAVILTQAKAARVPVACGPAAEATHVELSRNADFAKGKKIALSSGEVASTVPPGDWFLRCLGKENAMSSVRRFRVVAAGQYKVFRPEKGEINFEDKAVLRLEFKPPQSVTSTTVEVADNASFARPVFSESGARTSFSIDLPKAGKYYYRLTPANEAGRVDSQLTPFTANVTLVQVQSRVALQFVTVTQPTFPLTQIEAGKATVGYEGSGKYAVQISRRGEAKPVYSGETQGGVVAIPKNLTGGKYTLLLAAGNERAELPFDIRDKIKVELKSPANGTVLALTPGEKSTGVSVSWMGSDDVQNYQLLVASDSGMKNIIKKANVEGNEYGLTGLGAGKYYVKVLALENNIARAETATAQVSVEDRLPPVPEMPDRKVDVSRTAGLNLKWQPVAGANSYEVKIFQKRKDGLALVETRTTKGAALAMTDVRKLHEGDVVLEVRAQQTDKAGKVVQKSEPTRTNVNVSFGPTPPAPEIVPTVDE